MKLRWIVVAGVEGARVFEQRAPVDRFHLIEELFAPPGSPVGHGPVAVTNHSIVDELAAALDRHLEWRRFEELAVVAPPALLALLRSRLSPRVAATVRETVAKDMYHASEVSLPEDVAALSA